MPYIYTHHGSFWFRIRVPAKLVSKYGASIRQNLQTTDQVFARTLALRLASDWLARFAYETIDRNAGSDPILVSTPSLPAPGVIEILPDSVSLPSQPVTVAGRDTVGMASIPVAPSAQGRNMVELAQYWKHINAGARESTKREFESVAKAFHKVIKKPVATLQRTDIVVYRDHLLQRGLARSTVSKHVGMVSTLLQTAYDTGELPQNVARGLRIPKTKVTPPPRRGFKADDLAKLFASPLYTQHKRYRAAGGEAGAWAPLIGLATGARLEEICQLRTCDLRIDTELGPILSITDEGDTQRLKTETSRRVIPVHAELVHAGLLTYWESLLDAGEAWLFPELEPDHDGRRGGNLGKWFARYLRSPEGANIQDPRVVFHSTRHSFKTACRLAKLKEEVHDALTGHAGATVGRTYGEMPLEPLVEAIARVRFPLPFPVVCA